MSLEDVAVVHQIDLLSFSTPWPERSYKFEVSHNKLQLAPGLLKWLMKMDKARVAAMAVLWFIVDEIHIATIAVHPDYRGTGLWKMVAGVRFTCRERGGGLQSLFGS